MHTVRISVILLLLLTSGCAARRTDGTVNFHASMVETVLIAEATYEEIMIGIGDSFRDGIINRSTLERGRTMGNGTFQAIVAAKSTLTTYLRAGGMSGGMKADVFTALATLATLVANLERFYVNETGSLLPGSLK